MENIYSLFVTLMTLILNEFSLNMHTLTNRAMSFQRCNTYKIINKISDSKPFRDCKKMLHKISEEMEALKINHN